MSAQICVWSRRDLRSDACIMRRTQRTPNAKLSDQDYKQGERLVLIQQLAPRLGNLFRLMSLRRSTDATASLLTTRLIRRKISSHQSGSNLRENALRTANKLRHIKLKVKTRRRHFLHPRQHRSSDRPSYFR